MCVTGLLCAGNCCGHQPNNLVVGCLVFLACCIASLHDYSFIHSLIRNLPKASTWARCPSCHACLACRISCRLFTVPAWPHYWQRTLCSSPSRLV